MKFLRVGLKTGDLIGIFHKELVLTSKGTLLLQDAGKNSAAAAQVTRQAVIIRATNGKASVIVAGKSAWEATHLLVKTDPPDATFTLRSSATDVSAAKPPMTYRGSLEISAQHEGLQAVLNTDLETYVEGVLQSELPAYFNLEAMKAQAVVARSYGLHPRLPHPDKIDVCDSYLHCQAFTGLRTLTADQQAAIDSTKGEILVYEDKPALALFSACGGGHTEDYQFCFSDPITNAFPPPPVPYLKGVAEGGLPAGYPSEQALRVLLAMAHPDTDDGWSQSSFRWHITFTADALEAHMHHFAVQLMSDEKFAPFIHPPKSGKFGHIKSFTVRQRGVAGTAVHLEVDTTSGAWLFDKELTIRNLFENPDLKLKRLKSARVVFDHACDRSGFLHSLTVSGLGSGHGVGLQQVGAQGLAKRGRDYKQILAHYYPPCAIAQA